MRRFMTFSSLHERKRQVGNQSFYIFLKGMRRAALLVAKTIENYLVAEGQSLA